MKSISPLVGLVAACLFGLGLFGSGTASADPTLFSNLGQSVDGAGFLPNTSRRLASDFQTGSDPTIITGATLKLENNDTVAHTYTASIFTDNAGLPGTMVGTFVPVPVPDRTSPGSGPADFATTPAGVINLSASTPYWQVLQVNENGVGFEDAEWKFTTSQSTDAGSIFTTLPATLPLVSTNGGASWSNLAAGNFQFSLSGVPEPTSGLLLLVGAPVLLATRRNKKPGRG